MVTLVSTKPGAGIVAYAAGQVHGDGEGFIDFVAVDPAWHRQGLGRQLVMTVARTLLMRSTRQRVSLGVQDHRTAARSLYAQLGFRSDGSFIGYRSRTSFDARRACVDGQ
jgi:ribosomal protein S18 acetylase RimI-like enzyme